MYQVANVIGAGLRLFPRIKRDLLGLTSNEAHAWSRHVKAEFELWANHCDFLSRNNFYELQRVEVFGKQSGLRNVLQIAADTRPDQFRGVPYLANVIEPLKQISRYGDAELVSAIIRSFFSVFFTQTKVDRGINEIVDKVDVDVSEYRLGEGTMNALPPGVDVTAVNSSNQTEFDSFVGNFVKQIGAALNIRNAKPML